MKLIITILLFISLKASAINYYVSNAGSNAANGTTAGTSWQTISKVNSTATTNDSVFFKKGDTWNEKIVPASNSIYYGSYSTGNKPVITALQTVTGFSQNGNIWTKTLISVVDTAKPNEAPGLNVVLIDGAIRAKGRYPNSGYLTYVYGTTNVSKVVFDAISDYPNYVGAECVVKGSTYTIDTRRIVSQVVDSFFLSSPVTYVLYANGFFIQNLASLLDVQYEWAFERNTNVLSVYSTTSPTVKVSVFDTLVNIRRKNNITLDGLSFEGANRFSILVDTSDNYSIKNCSIINSGEYGIRAKQSNNGIIKYNTFSNTMGSCIALGVPIIGPTNKCNNTLIDSNDFRNSAKVPGMGMGWVNSDQVIFAIGDSTTITHNTADSSGYVGFHFQGKKTLVKNNVISNYCLTKSDGGGVYTYGGYYPVDNNDGSIVRKNIIFNGIGNLEGAGVYAEPGAPGIYFDNLTRRCVADSNTIFNTSWDEITLHQASEDTILRNTIVSTAPYQSFPQKGGIAWGNQPATSNTIKQNLIYSPSTPGIIRSTTSLFAESTVDSNHYINSSANKFNNSAVVYSLAGWRTATGYDLHSDTTIPARAVSVAPTLFYNPTGRDSTLNLYGDYVDYFDNIYFGQALIRAYESKLLFPAQFVYTRKVGGFKFL